MSVNTLSFSLIQTSLFWEDKEANLAMRSEEHTSELQSH